MVNYVNNEILVYVVETNGYGVITGGTGFFQGGYNGVTYSTSDVSSLQNLGVSDVYDTKPDPLSGFMDIGDHSNDYPADENFYYISQTGSLEQSSIYNLSQSIKSSIDVIGNSVEAVDLTLKYTTLGSNIAYDIAYCGSMAKGMNYIKSFGYVAGSASVLTDCYLSAAINPQTGESYQTWNETIVNGSVTVACLVIGGIPGIVIGIGYSIFSGIPIVVSCGKPNFELQDNTRVVKYY